ncbi:MAG: hypothetical protein QOJ72_95 [Nocardioidaceae bacterium]|nr:hypothetical protein [Nocardioidaceae bacterium]
MTSQTMETDELVVTEGNRALGWLMTIGGALALYAATILTIDKLTLLQDKIDGTVKQLGCDRNAFVSCSAVMDSDQAHAFGFANSIIGIGAFAVVLTLGVLVLARVELPGFIWVGLQVGVLFGIGFVTWLQSQSIYEIGKLCPWCMVVWSVMIPLFVLVTARNLRAWSPTGAISRLVNDWTLLIVILWYVAVIAAVWFKFGSDLWA